MTVHEVAISGPGVSDSRAGGADGPPAAKRRKGRVGRAVRPTLAMAPFFIYTALGLGIPTVAVIDKAFRSESGKLTLANIHTVTHGTYLVGFKNSIILAAIASIVPGILGLILAYAIQTSHSSLLRRLVTTASGVLANFGGINLTFIFIATIGSTGVLTAWLNAVKANPWNHGFNLYSFYGVAIVYLYFQIPLMVLVITPALGGSPSGLARGSGEVWEPRASGTGAPSAYRCCCPRCSERCCCSSAARSPPMPRRTP